MTDTPVDSPLFKLIDQLVRQDEVRAQQYAEIKALLTDVRNGQTRAEATTLDIRNELQRQDQQMQLFDRRISGNYMGISAQFDVIGEEQRELRGAFGNVERAVVELSRDTKTVHGRLIEMSDKSGARQGEIELDLTALGERLAAVEAQNGTVVEPVAAAAMGGLGT